MIKALIFDFFGVVEQNGQSNKPLLAYISKLKKHGYKIGILSNANENWVSKLLSDEEIEHFDNVVISYDVGMAKPHPSIYEKSLSNLGVKPNEAVFIDDIEHFCIAARDTGMQAVCYESFEQTKEELDEILVAGADN